MKFVSTRDKSKEADFFQAVLNPLPPDGGMYVPLETEDLRRWLLYTDETTPFTSIAGSLTSAFINDEFSPIICETIATKAFNFSPEIKQLGDSLFLLDLAKGPTGIHRDFGISYLVSFLDTTLQLKGEKAVFLDTSTGELGASLAVAMRGKKNLKAVILYPKGTVRGLEESDFVWNGGNIYPVEIDGTEDDCNKFVREIFAERSFIEKNNITLANTVNIGRLISQAFFYPFAFSRIKNKVRSDIFYALAAGNYSNVVAGLYAWQFALPVNGFIIPANNYLTVDLTGNPLVLDSIIPLEDRADSDPSKAFNLERLEDIFSANQLMMKHFIFPEPVSDTQVEEAVKELFVKYGYYADRHTAKAYAAAKMHKNNSDGDYATVLISRDHPSYSEDFIRQTLGEAPEMPENIKKALKPTEISREVVTTTEELKAIISSL